MNATPGVEPLETRLLPSALPAPRVVPYGPDPRQYALVYPHAGGPAPVAFLVHGGGWFYGNPRRMDAFTRHFLGEGYAVVNAEYRHTTPDANQWPVPAQDVAAALAWAKANAASCGGDPARVLGVGQSAGGELLGMAAYHPEGDWLQPELAGADLSLWGFLGSSGVYDLRTAPRRWEFGCYLKPLTGAACGPGRTAWDARKALPASPAAFADPADPPALLLVGANDPAYARIGRAFRDALTAAGVPAALYAIPDAGHADVKRLLGHSKALTAAIDAFLASLPLPEAPP